jgi:Bcr/CflA subfamily drug resistance transporter
MNKSVKLIIAVSLLFASFGQIASDLYLPSLPNIAADLNTKRELVQLTVTCFMISYCIARLFYGPLSDGIGRRKPLVVGFLCAFVGSLICLYSGSISVLMVGRVIQGFGAAAGSVLTGAILRDLLEGKLLAKFNSYFALVNVVFVASAPLVGGYLEVWFGWRSTFLFLTVYTLVLLLITIFVFPETNTHKDLSHIKLSGIVSNFSKLLKSKIFISYTLLVMAGYAAILAWMTSGTIIIQKQLNYSPVLFGWFAMSAGFSYCVGAFINGKLVMSINGKKLILFGASLMFCAGVVFLFTAKYEILSIYNVMIPVLIFSFGNSFIFPNSYSAALTPFPKQAGSASAILSSMQILGGVVGSALVALLPCRSIFSLGAVVIVCGFVSIFVICSTVKRIRKNVYCLFFSRFRTRTSQG